MFVREAEFQDYSKIAKLHATSWQQVYQGLLDDDYLENRVEDEHMAMWQTRLTQPPLNQGVLVLEEAGALCGFVCLYGNHSFDQGTMIDNLHVHKDQRGKGYGKALLAEAATWAQKHFADSGIYLEVLKGNDPAKAFYQSLNGQDDGDFIWRAPCGSQVACHTYCWESPKALLKATK
ncbi:GNAT family N-acetyltransferase [Vibrio algivorus]|uniref:N-acetyltransferase n=1 Tax=Vibrio algivorus TaxID=1667024 RepID=A0A557P019_9VIBR|nr:GNAT family N-acetyltransferase [Vibrio algivorus]TVO34015.1 GNAT family N-acetyltransferase [Vibrio algivorus]GLT13765.1 N-acetyltransferase [Vibrio algivorus]